MDWIVAVWYVIGVGVAWVVGMVAGTAYGRRRGIEEASWAVQLMPEGLGDCAIERHIGYEAGRRGAIKAIEGLVR